MRGPHILRVGPSINSTGVGIYNGIDRPTLGGAKEFEVFLAALQTLPLPSTRFHCFLNPSFFCLAEISASISVWISISVREFGFDQVPTLGANRGGETHRNRRSRSQVSDRAFFGLYPLSQNLMRFLCLLFFSGYLT